MSQIPLKVRTYSGYKADERPLSFTLGDRSFEVVEVLDGWYGQDHAYFKLLADDGNRYILRHHMDSDSWEMVMMEAKGAPEE